MTSAESSSLNTLYAAHLAEQQRRTEHALQRGGYDALLIASGIEKFAFLDDRPYVFQTNPHFKLWVPLVQHTDSWLVIRPGHKPRLVYCQPEDYWHVPPAAPSGFWVEHFELIVIRRPEDARQHLQLPGRLAIVGEADAALEGVVPNNPPEVLNPLHYARAVKTPYELLRLREASTAGARAHLAAQQAFREGRSEAEIHRAYLAASGHAERDLPYGNIVALNEHAAVLHYQYQETKAPAQSLSLLVDAGAHSVGYASDITRTTGNGDASFQALIDAMEAAQLRLVDRVRAGVDYRDIHLASHREIAGVLRQLDIVKMDEDAMLAERVTSTFLPHGIGHLLGLQVHDIGGFMASEEGGTLDKPEGHRYLRLTRVLQPGMVVTIEPGLYFIPMLLDQLRATPAAAQVDWSLVKHLSAFGGVRIEDDVACTDTGAPENMTREAFAALG
ncbi:MAG: Xaa-Pro dipeptidase [Mitsuaria chitosanitabida]|uniref:Xaa-Pro dipeptidase n=1 Tax=Roseateles chitosanitabidus TaxID=65048 RepID=UPI001B16B5DD|nr:Xaa-Pro dipeptidase [Roseateles chitosanitabidus]MBO9687010.1 Xaa-Pro dipeptidase [Roseateles chitosanitabidus]